MRQRTTSTRKLLVWVVAFLRNTSFNHGISTTVLPLVYRPYFTLLKCKSKDLESAVVNYAHEMAVNTTMHPLILKD